MELNGAVNTASFVAYIEQALGRIDVGVLDSLRVPKARTRDARAEALQMASDWISESDAKNWLPCSLAAKLL